MTSTVTPVALVAGGRAGEAALLSDAPAPAFEIRPASAGDVAAMLDLWEAVAAEGRWIGAEAPLDLDERRRQIEEALDDDRQARYVAVADREVVGHLGISLSAYGVAELVMLVAAGWRRRGVGAALLQAAIGWAREAGAHKVALQVWPHNAAARALYRKFGFVEEGVLRRHYPRRNGELWDAVVMGLVLDEGAPRP